MGLWLPGGKRSCSSALLLAKRYPTTRAALQRQQPLNCEKGRGSIKPATFRGEFTLHAPTFAASGARSWVPSRLRVKPACALDWTVALPASLCLPPFRCWPVATRSVSSFNRPAER